MDKANLQFGTRVRVSRLVLQGRLNLTREQSRARKKGVIGTLQFSLVGFGGNIWIVKQDNRKEGAYHFEELEEIP